MNKGYLVYKRTLNSDGRVYIGITHNSLDKRAGNNGIKYDGCIHFYNAIKKYGWENFSSEILEEGLSKEKAEEREIFWIEQYHATDPKFGFNMAKGGNLAFPFNNGIKVNQYTLEGKYIKTFPTLFSANESVGFKGVTGAARGECSHAGGYVWRIASDEFPEGKDLEDFLLRNKKMVPINQYTLEGKYIKTFHSMNEAVKETGLVQSSIWSVCRGQRKRVGEFTFRLYDDFKDCKDIDFVYQSSEKQVNAYTLDGKYLNTYKNVRETERQLGAKATNISKCCKHKAYYAKGYMFRFTSEVEPGLDIEPLKKGLGING